MIYRVTHATSYEYSAPAALSLNDVCLVARSTDYQRVISQTFETEPAEDHARDRVDFFGNRWRFYAFERPHTLLRIVSHHEVEVDRGRGMSAGPPASEGTEPFVTASPFVRTTPTFADYARASFVPGRDRVDALVDLTQRIFREFTYDPKATDIATPVEEFFRLRRGVCQDYSHLMLSVLRSRGIPARYVSGYLNTLPPPGKEKVWGADASHAWVSAFVQGLGWVDLDPTNGIVVANDHITLAWGRDYGDVTPLRGVVLGGGTQTLKVEVTVAPQA